MRGGEKQMRPFMLLIMLVRVLLTFCRRTGRSMTSSRTVAVRSAVSCCW